MKVSAQPEGYPEGYAATNLAKYFDRGWCFGESSMGNLVKDSSLALDLALFSGTQKELGGSFSGVIKECQAGRPPPLPPAEFEKLLASKSFAKPKDEANKAGERSDEEIVAAMYKRAFEALVGAAEELNYIGLGWGDEEAKVLAGALGAAKSCWQLSLFDNAIGDAGAAALAASLRAGAAPKLERIDLNGNASGRRARRRSRRACARARRRS